MNNSPDRLPDPLSAEAETRWAEFRDAAATAGVSFPEDRELTDRLKSVFAFSEFVAGNSIRAPGRLAGLIRSGDLHRRYEPHSYEERLRKMLREVTEENGLMTILRQFRGREMIRIACRDLGRLADLDEILTDLSALADACIRCALDLLHAWHCDRFGVPCDRDGTLQQLVVLGMGKLGARELNFSSDVDLIFAYPEAGETRDGPRTIENKDFFLRLGRRLIHVLGSNTAEGFVFRVDMNLRPFGESGPLVMSFDAAESYYQEQGREWERYAWIKARTVAGDGEAGAELLRRLNPFIFRRYLDYGVFESLRDMKQKIALEVRRKDMADNIKLGAGGIREIEFFGQIFQLIRGGVEPALQERRIQKVLPILAGQGYIEQEVCEQLLGAYRFFRETEHRLQAFSDSQTHQLPRDRQGRLRLAVSMGFPDWSAFSKQLQAHRSAVHHHFNSLLKTDDTGHDHTATDDNRFADIWNAAADDPERRELLLEAGYEDPDTVFRRLAEFQEVLSSRPVSSEGRNRINRLMPRLIEKIGGAEQPETVLERVLNLVRTIRRRTSYVSLLLEHPDALNHLVRLADTSAWILTFLTRHPVLLDELLDPRTLYRPPERSDLETEIRERLSAIDPDDLEQQMDVLRIFRQINTLRVAAADITDAIPLMRVSDHLSDIAETVLNEVVELAWRHLVATYGTPVCYPDTTPCERGFVVIAYGKLGGLELGYSSDLDLVFLHSGTGDDTEGGRRTIDSGSFFARLGQRVVHILTAHTSTGTLYEADMRLRPSGSSGMLVCPVDAFRTYQMEEAWTWEKQALVRARPLAGDQRLMERFQEIRREVLGQHREPALLREEIRKMRNRMRKELLRTGPGVFDLKQGAGGMVDIEFLVQYLVLRYARRHPDLLTWTDNVRLIGTLLDAGVIDETAAYFLRKAYLIYRSVGHKLSLRERPAQVDEERFRHLKQVVVENWKRYMGSGTG